MFYPLYADYEILNKKPIIKISGRNEKGEKIVFEDKNFEPYFYAIPEQDKIEEIKKRIENLVVNHNEEKIKIKRVEIVERIEINKKLKVLKIFCYLPRDVSLLKEEVRHTKGVLHKREYDIPFAKRYCIDKQISFLSPYKIENNELKKQEGKLYNPNVAAFDIEIYKPSFDAKENKIICIGLYAKDKKIVFTWKPSNLKEAIVVKDEKEMIKKFFELMKQFDILLSYNGDNFDLPFLKIRAEELKLEPPILLSKNRVNFRDVQHIDLYNIITKHLSAEVKTRTNKLDEVAMFFLGEGKIDLDIYKNGTSKEIWDSNDISKIDEILNYNLQDCRITYLIGEKVLPLEYRFSNLIGVNLVEITRSGFSQLVENYLMKEAVRKNILIKNKPTDKEIEERKRKTYMGGYVYKPIPGLYENIHVLDFKSLYPSILVSHNISPDSLDENGEIEIKIDGKVHKFTKRRKGFIVDVVDNLIRKRAEIKKKYGKGVDEKALKTLANATYGYLGFFGARWYSLKCAESITALGRKYITETIKKAERTGFKVIYGDTDSLMVIGERSKIKNFLDEINKSLPKIMELEYEGFYKRGIFVGSATGGAKKRYALMDEKGNVEIKGFEFVRGDWSLIAKETQEKVLKFVLDNNEKEAIKFVDNIIRKIKRGEIEKEKLIISRQLTKNLDSYAQTAPHVKVAKELKRRGIKINKGLIVQYIITKEGKTISEKAKWFEEAKNYDPNYYINNQIIPAAIRILGVLGYSKNDFLREQKSLTGF